MPRRINSIIGKTYVAPKLYSDGSLNIRYDNPACRWVDNFFRRVEKKRREILAQCNVKYYEVGDTKRPYLIEPYDMGFYQSQMDLFAKNL